MKLFDVLATLSVLGLTAAHRDPQGNTPPYDQYRGIGRIPGCRLPVEQDHDEVQVTNTDAIINAAAGVQKDTLELLSKPKTRIPEHPIHRRDTNPQVPQESVSNLKPLPNIPTSKIEEVASDLINDVRHSFAEIQKAVMDATARFEAISDPITEKIIAGNSYPKPYNYNDIFCDPGFIPDGDKGPLLRRDWDWGSPPERHVVGQYPDGTEMCSTFSATGGSRTLGPCPEPNAPTKEIELEPQVCGNKLCEDMPDYDPSAIH